MGDVKSVKEVTLGYIITLDEEEAVILTRLLGDQFGDILFDVFDKLSDALEDDGVEWRREDPHITTRPEGN